MLFRNCRVFSGFFVLMGVMSAYAQEQPDVRNEEGTYIARGKWNPTEHKGSVEVAGLPLVEIHCFKTQKYCMQATASVHGAEPGLADQYYLVTRWDKTGIADQNEDFSCTTNEIKIDFKENSVQAVDSPRKAGGSVLEACKAMAHAITYNLVGEGHGLPEQGSGTPNRSPAQTDEGTSPAPPQP